MRLFVAGGTGALRARIIRLLARGGHDVTATARISHAGGHGLVADGAETPAPGGF